LAGPNFGSGSSREHAVWALEDAGFRTVIAPSFADIFRNNCFKIGVLPVELAQESVRALMDAVLDDPTTEITVDLHALRVSAPAVHEAFEIDPYTRWRLLEGLDDIDLTLRHAEAIDAFERERPAPPPPVPPPRDAAPGGGPPPNRPKAVRAGPMPTVPCRRRNTSTRSISAAAEPIGHVGAKTISKPHATC